MSIQFSQRKPKSEDCKQAIQTVQQQVQEAALAAITVVLETFLEAEVTAKLGRKKGKPRQGLEVAFLTPPQQQRR